MRILALDEEEAQFLNKVIDAWTAVHTENAEGVDFSQSQRLSVLRKIQGRYTKEELADLVEAAVKFLKR